MPSVKNASTQELIDELLTRTDADPVEAAKLPGALLENYAMVVVYDKPNETPPESGTSLLYKWKDANKRNVVIGNITPLLLSTHDVKTAPFPE